jgi:hypothetical protein
MIWMADVLMAAGTMGAGLYCLVLSRRLRRFTDLEKGVGGAVAVLSAQVDDLTRALARAESQGRQSVGTLTIANDRAEAAARRIELLLASLHDLPGAAPTAPASPIFVRHPESADRAP